MEGEVFYGGGKIWDTLGLCNPTALLPLTAANTIGVLGQSGHWPTSTRWRRTYEQTT